MSQGWSRRRTYRQRHLSSASPSGPPGQVRQRRTQIRDPDIICARGAQLLGREDQGASSARADALGSGSARSFSALVRNDCEEERLRSPRSFRLPLSLQGSTLQSMLCLFDNRTFCVGLRQGMDPMVKPWVTTKQGDAINPSLVIPVRGAFEYPLAGGSLYRPGRPLFFGRPRLRFSSAGSS